MRTESAPGHLNDSNEFHLDRNPCAALCEFSTGNKDGSAGKERRNKQGEADKSRLTEERQARKSNGVRGKNNGTP